MGLEISALPQRLKDCVWPESAVLCLTRRLNAHGAHPGDDRSVKVWQLVPKAPFASRSVRRALLKPMGETTPRYHGALAHLSAAFSQRREGKGPKCVQKQKQNPTTLAGSSLRAIPGPRGRGGGGWPRWPCAALDGGAYVLRAALLARGAQGARMGLRGPAAHVRRCAAPRILPGML